MKISKAVSESLVTFSLEGAEDHEIFYAVLTSLQRIRPMLTLSDDMSEQLESLFHRLKNDIIKEKKTEYRYHFLSSAALVGLMKTYDKNELPAKACMTYLQELLSFEVTFINDPEITHLYKVSGKEILSHLEKGGDHDRH